MLWPGTGKKINLWFWNYFLLI